MGTDRLFGYGGSDVDRPKAFVLVPEGTTTEQFLDSMVDGPEFVSATQGALNAAEKGDLKEADRHLGTMVRLNGGYGLRGLTEYTQYVMGVAIEKNLQGGTVTRTIENYASKYGVELKK